MKDCVKYQEMISAMLDGELTGEQQRELEEHLALCPECRAMHTAFLSLSEALGEDVTPVPAGLHDKIMTGVKAVEKKNKRSLIVALRPYMAAAACLVVIVAAVLAARESGLLRGMTKNDAAEDTRTENSTAAAESYHYSSTKQEEAKAEQQSVPAEGIAADTATKEETAAEEESDTGNTDVTTESGALETTPEPTPTPEPIELDAVECVLTTTVDGKVIAETLSETDTKVWISTLILSGDKYAENVDPSLISYRMEITREDGEVYTVYLHYGEGDQLMLSRAEDGSEAIEVNEIRDFTEYAEETEADK